MTIKEQLLETINRDGVRWLDPAHPHYVETLAAARHARRQNDEV